MQLHLFSTPGENDIRDIVEASRPYLEGKDDPVVAYMPLASLYAERWMESNEKSFKGLARFEAVNTELMTQKEIEDVQLGYEVWMKASALPQHDFQGRVDLIAPVVQTADGQRTVTIRSALLKNSELLKPDMTGVAHIYAGKRPIISIATRRMRRWLKTEFVPLLPF